MKSFHKYIYNIAKCDLILIIYITYITQYNALLCPLLMSICFNLSEKIWMQTITNAYVSFYMPGSCVFTNDLLGRVHLNRCLVLGHRCQEGIFAIYQCIDDPVGKTKRTSESLLKEKRRSFKHKGPTCTENTRVYLGFCNAFQTYVRS